MPIRRPGSASGSAMFSIMIEEVLVASTAPGLSLPSIDLNRFCLTSSFSTIASITTSARPMLLALGIGDQPGHGGGAQRLGLELAGEQLLLRGDALGDLLGIHVLQRHLHAGGDAPAGDVGAHDAGADHVHAQRLEGEALRRLRLHHLRQLEHAAQVARGVAHHQRREGARLGDLHALEVAGVRLEQVDQAEGRGIVLLAHLLGGLGAQLLGQQPARRPLPQQVLPERPRAWTCACARPPCAPPSAG